MNNNHMKFDDQAPLTIKIKYLADIDELKQIDVGDMIDVRAAKDIKLKYMQNTKIPLGFSCQLPAGYMAFLMPRSSTFDKYGIIQTNSIGGIDESYCGDDDEWAMPVISLRNDVCIPKNERIGQFMIVPKMGKVNLEPVDTLGNKNRGGFGSTGRV